ncbi:hypothetical protein NYE24_28595 [Paenibacillus sp. FSL H7-0350]|uniref:hypothetical protein n=1 Tax=Paenibacillus sp. FSL H7-0350 TaxID=2975345 RepID=UPI003158B7BF
MLLIAVIVMRGTTITAIEPVLTLEIIISSQVPGPMRAATTKTAPTKSIQARTGTAAPAIIMVITKGIIHMIITITMEAVTGITAATEAGTAAVTVDMEAAILAAEILAVAETNS